MSQFDPSWREIKLPQRGDPRARVAARLDREQTRSKYGAVPTCVLPDLRVLPANACEAVSGAIKFASKREAERCVTLTLEQRDGVIQDLTLQPAFPLHTLTPGGVKVQIGRYIADFSYLRNGARVIEDAKGFAKKDLYVWKKKHVEAEHGITVVEV